MRRITMPLTLATVLATVLATTPARAQFSDPFSIVRESAVFDPQTSIVRFQVVFNRAPDFFTVDQVGRPATEFQYEVLPQPVDPADPNNFVSVVRGAEIHFGEGLPIRAGRPSVDDPRSGGWGAIRATVPFTLVGTVLTFEAPLAVVDPAVSDGRFSYILLTATYGRENDRRIGHTVVSTVPEPSAAMLLGLGLLLVAGAAVRRRHSARIGTAPPEEVRNGEGRDDGRVLDLARLAGWMEERPLAPTRVSRSARLSA